MSWLRVGVDNPKEATICSGIRLVGDSKDEVAEVLPSFSDAYQIIVYEGVTGQYFLVAWYKSGIFKNNVVQLVRRRIKLRRRHLPEKEPNASCKKLPSEEGHVECWLVTGETPLVWLAWHFVQSSTTAAMQIIRLSQGWLAFMSSSSLGVNEFLLPSEVEHFENLVSRGAL